MSDDARAYDGARHNIVGFPADATGGGWPVMAPEAYHGLAGEVVARILPQTEADAVNLLTSFLVAFGSAAGAVPHALADGHRHTLNLYVAHVGPSGSGRKGSGWRQIRRLMERVDDLWTRECIGNGLSSGEGLIEAIQLRQQAETGTTGDGRLCTVEEEFGMTLGNMGREHNSLSGVLRQLWDGPNASTMTRKPLKVLNAYLSVIGHITEGELEERLTGNDATNGFANRFLWMCVRRSKLLEEGGDPIDYGTLIRRIHTALQFARSQTHPFVRTADARARWKEMYRELTARQPGIIGVITGRGEAQTLRLSVLYAALDQSPVVELSHLEAAYAVWRYCEDSARYIFVDALGDPIADVILQALTDAAPEGVGQTDISSLFSRNTKSSRLRRALRDLHAAGLVTRAVKPTRTRPRTVWYAAPLLPGEEDQ